MPTASDQISKYGLEEAGKRALTLPGRPDLEISVERVDITNRSTRFQVRRKIKEVRLTGKGGQ